MNSKIRKKACLFFSVFMLLSNLALARSLRDDIKISLEEHQIQDFSLSGLSLVFYVKIANSSSKLYYLSSYNYRFVVNQIEYIHLKTSLEGGLMINPGGSTFIALPVKITYELLFQNVSGIEEQDKAQCYLMGELGFSEGRRERGGLPIVFSGEFPIFKKPEVELVNLVIKAHTIGGADLAFNAEFINKNSYELFVDSIHYSIKLGGFLLSEGYISGDKNIEKHGKKPFSLPILLNFFEVSKDVSSILKQPSAVCQFSGEFDLRTIWGRLTIPFDKIEQIALGPDFEKLNSWFIQDNYQEFRSLTQMRYD